MADTFKRLYQGQLPTTAGTLYTAPDATAVMVKHMRLVNVDAGARTAKLWHGGTDDTTVILPTVTFEAGEWAEFDGLILLEAGHVLAGEASDAGAITLTVYGLAMT